MSNPAFNIKHGTLTNVTGRPARTDLITFLPADVVLSGDPDAISFSHPLGAYLPQSSAEARAMVKPHEDAPWTLGRILFLFGRHLLDDINEYRSDVCLYFQSFMAVIHAMDNLSIPFECGDRFCESALRFSSDDSLLPETKDLIAGCFWSLLLASPAEVEDYECGMLHSKIGGGRIRFGIEGGEPFLIDTGE